MAEGGSDATAGTGGSDRGSSLGGIKAWLTQMRALGWKKTWPFALTGAFLILYVVLTGNPVPLIAAFAIAWLTRKFADQIDDRLRPLWPVRERVPRKLRMILAWVAPMGIGFLVSGSPQLFNLFAWLPMIGPDASLFVFLSAISAFVAYLLIREPKRGTAT